MAERVPHRPGIDASKLRVPTRTSYHSRFFVLHTEIILNGQPAEIGCSGGRELTLSCRYFPVPGAYSTERPCVSYPSISGKVEEILQAHGVFQVVNFFCEDAPLFQVTFSSEYALKQFLKQENKIKEDLAALFSEVLQPSQQPGAPAIRIPTLVNVALFLIDPDPAAKDCARLTEVTLDNHSTCMAVWKESEVFDFGDLFRVLRLDPKKLAHEGTIRLDTLMSELYEVHEWVSLGTHLGIEHFRLKRIAIDHRNDFDQAVLCMQSMLQVWIDTSDGEPSWTRLVRALCIIGRMALAKKIACKYGATLPPMVFRADQESSTQKEQDTAELIPGACKVLSQQEPSAQSQLQSLIERSDRLFEKNSTTVKKVEENKTKASSNYHLVKRRLSAALSNVDQLHRDKMALMKQIASREKALRISETANCKQNDLGDSIRLQKRAIQQFKEQLQQKNKEITDITAEADDLKAQLENTTEEMVSTTTELNKLKTKQQSLHSDLERNRQALEKEKYRSLFKDDTIKELKLPEASSML